MADNVRLSKVLRELNISIDRAIDFLESKSIEIEKRPTAKISAQGRINLIKTTKPLLYSECKYTLGKLGKKSRSKNQLCKINSATQTLHNIGFKF